MHRPTVILMSLLAFFVLLSTVLVTYIAARPNAHGTGGNYYPHHYRSSVHGYRHASYSK